MRSDNEDTRSWVEQAQDEYFKDHTPEQIREITQREASEISDEDLEAAASWLDNAGTLFVPDLPMVMEDEYITEEQIQQMADDGPYGRIV